jgi:hypothetical protein
LSVRPGRSSVRDLQLLPDLYFRFPKVALSTLAYVASFPGLTFYLDLVLPSADAADGALSQAERFGYGRRDIAALYTVLGNVPAQ